ncbi:uncharacterized serine-rich protein C215.13-like isoform X2 [Acanthaster planci]|uniref:Uncharacterized serine-rich protein C215.13-like isoform X2 n=1 Tax=Acanthaster planci TaxID=133434 RepID=A0A8B7YUT8_ACAPL|nr:uncharacterized serine-rich protein C215.13-like isoform X2 [Acanthaster planci]
MAYAAHPGGGPWWAKMPLPPGWDAKYDHNTKKYFYIHHTTRSTQWHDPRKAYYEQQQQQQRIGGLAPGPAASPYQRSPQMPQRSAWTPSPGGPAIPLQPIAKPKCKICRTNEVPSANQECQSCQLKARQREAELVRAREEKEAERRKQEAQQRIEKEQERRRVQSAARSRTPVTSDYHETSFGTEPERVELTVGQKRAMIENLDEAFPGIERSVVEMVLETSSWDSGKATTVLMSMTPQKDKKKSTTAPMAKAAAKPQASMAKPSAAASTSPPKQPTAAVKSKMIDNLKKMFPSASETLVELALETTHYNQAKATQVLRMTISSDGKKDAKKSDTKAKTTASTTSTSFSVGTSSVGSSGASTSTTVVAPQPKTSASRQSTSLPSTPTAPATSRQAKAAARAKGAARRTRSAERAPKQEFHSLYSFKAQGPDAALVHGPDKKNLLDTYVDYMGRDGSIVQGPRKENVAGPGRREGHNASLAVGPQGSHYTGPQANLAKGSMHGANRQM